ncbi:hypothetical protein GCM10027517_27580 [Phycicoccus ginsengisoli]
MSTARTSRSVQPTFRATGRFSDLLRVAVAGDWGERAAVGTERSPHAGCTAGCTDGNDNATETSPGRDLRRIQSRGPGPGGAGLDWPGQTDLLHLRRTP